MNTAAAGDIKRTEAWILAGGRGERLRPLTVSRPKPLVSFGGAFRIIDFTLSNCLHSGISRVSLLTQCGHHEIQQYLGQGWNDLWSDGKSDRHPLRLLQAVDGKSYRGTADAVYQNQELLQHDSVDHVIVLSGDHVYHMDYRDLLRQHIEKEAELTISAVEYPIREASQFGVLEVDRNFRITGFSEKPKDPRPLPQRSSVALVSMGVYIFRRTVLLETVRKFCGAGSGFDFGHDIIPSLIPAGRTFAYDFRNDIENAPRYWRDIGTVDGYYRASMDLVSTDALFDPYANEGWPSQPTRHPLNQSLRGTDKTPFVDGNCCVCGSVLSPAVHVEENSIITDSILMPGVRVGSGARLRRTIVEEGVHIPAGFQAGFDMDCDIKSHTVTSSGVTVISRNPELVKPVAFQMPTIHTLQRRSKVEASYLKALAAAR